MKKYEGCFIQYAVGYNKDNITINDIKKAIVDVQTIDDDEHDVFWVGIDTNTDSGVLTVTKQLNISLTLDNRELDENVDYVANNWQEVEELFVLFLEQKIDKLISRIS